MKRLTSILIATLLISGCATTYQFLDAEDTIQLKFGMTKNDVKVAFGLPLEARAGLKLKSGDTIEIWTYKVKKQRTATAIDFNKVLPTWIIPKTKPDKEFKSNDWRGENTYGLIFQNGELNKWGYLNDDWEDYKLSDGDIIPPSSGAGGGLFGGGDKGSEGGLLSKIPLVGKVF